MKNLKVKNKLRLCFGVIIALTFVIAGLSLFGINQLKTQADTIVDKSLQNTDCVWRIRRNILSESRYYMLSLIENDTSKIPQYLEKASVESKENSELYEAYKSNADVDQSKIDALDATLALDKEYKNKFYTLINSNYEGAKMDAYDHYMNNLYPLIDQQAAILAEIGNEQITLAKNRIDLVNKVYLGVMIIVSITVIAALIITFILMSGLSKAILIPLEQIENASNALSQGDFSVDVNYESNDEFGITCDKIRYSFGELKRIITRTAETLGEVANGNFAVDTTLNFPGEMKGIESAEVALVKKMNNFFQEIKGSADQINSGADQVASGSQALAQGATEQASSLEELSASITEISNNVSENAQNSRKANELATISGDVAASTLKDMQEMLAAMNEISNSAENISKVIKVIDDITFQTNILSLNAAVEAARAGASGKGFAVVADEVRNLAQKSSDSAKEITTLIEGTIMSVKQGESIAHKTHDAFNELISTMKTAISTINQIASASEEQANSIQQITIGVDQISAVVQTNSATSEESAAASEELSSQANMLNSLVGQFRLSSEYGEF